MGLILVSTGRLAHCACYPGGVCDFCNQLQTSITAKTTRKGGFLANFKAGLRAPAAIAA